MILMSPWALEGTQRKNESQSPSVLARETNDGKGGARRLTG